MTYYRRARIRNLYSISILISIIIVFQLVLVVKTANAAVTLVSFTATPGEDIININWETATEYDNAGFSILRSLSENGLYDPLPIAEPEFIDAKGDGPTGAEYEFLDDDVAEGIIYYYKLEAFGIDGSSEIFGPVPVIIGDPVNTPTYTPTNTGTLNPTSTRTKTPTSQSTAIGATFTATKTPSKTLPGVSTWTTTPSRTPFSTSKPPTITPNQSGSFASTPTASNTSTAQEHSLVQTTSASFPPVSTDKDEFFSSKDNKVKSNLSDNQTESKNDDEIKTVSMVRTGLVMGVIALWGVLSVGVYYFIRQIKS